MTTIYLVRHCEAQGNIHKRMHGVANTDITPKGERQLEQLKRRFASLKWDAIYSSTLLRAYKTAQAIASIRGDIVHQVHDLRERDVGYFEDRTWHDIKENESVVFEAWRKNLYHYVIPQGESEEMSFRRFRSKLAEIGRLHPDSTVVVVAHSMVIKSFFEQELCPGEIIPYSDNTAVSCLYYWVEDDSFSAKYINDNSHLPDELSSFFKETWWKSAQGHEDYGLNFVHGAVDCELPTIEQEGAIYITGYARDIAVGYASYVISKNSCSVRIYVPPEYRERGYGTQMLGQIIVDARIYAIDRLEFTGAFPGNKILGFYEKNGIRKENNEIFSINIEKLQFLH